MGQVLHGCATTTEAIRRAIQHSQESLRSLSRRYGINPKTVAKWKKRGFVADLPTGPREPKSTVLSTPSSSANRSSRRLSSQRSSEPEKTPENTFSGRELEVLSILQEDKSNKTIARELGLSQVTIKVLVKNVLRKLVRPTEPRPRSG